MRVAFIQKDPMPDPALMVLGAAVVFRGHEAECFIPAAERDLEASLKAFAPAIVVFSPTTGFFGWALEQARRIRGMTGGAPNVFTGTHATDHPEIVREDGVDLVMVGDPETTLPELLLKIFKERELRGTSGTVALVDGELVRGPEREAIDDLDSLPLPDLEVYRRYGFVQRQTTLAAAVGRGVFENTHSGFRIGLQELQRRFRPARRHSVAEAIQRVHLMLQRRPNYRRVAFKDDSFLMEPLPWVHEFLSRYRDEIGLPFSCVAAPDVLDEAMVSRLANAGCALVRLAVESGDEGLRSAVLGRTVTDAQVVDAVARLRDRGIAVHTISFFGLPGETPQTATRTLDFTLELRPDHAFAILVADEEGASLSPEIERLQLLLPLAASAPVLRGAAVQAATMPGDGLYRALFQLHHDMAFVTGDELARPDVLRIVASMWRGRSARPARPMLQ